MVVHSVPNSFGLVFIFASKTLKTDFHYTHQPSNLINEINAEGGTVHKGKLNMLMRQIIKKHV